MRVLFIGGTGNLSTACTKQALAKNYEVYHLNRGTRPEKTPPGVVVIRADIRNPDEAFQALKGRRFDAVVQFVGFRPEQIAVDIDLFGSITDQYLFISTASAYKRPSLSSVVTEATALGNPFWEYSRLKIGCEEALWKAARERNFPVTIVRPSHTYDDGWIPTCFGSTDYGVAWRIENKKEIIVPGDGTALWTLTHASDFAKGLVGLLGNPAAVGEAFHITSEERLSWDAVHRLIGAAVGEQPRIVHIPSDYIARLFPERGAGLLGDKAHGFIFDNSKIRRFVPDFDCSVSFFEGIKRSVAWYNQRPDLKRPNQAVNEEIETILSYWSKALALLP